MIKFLDIGKITDNYEPHISTAVRRVLKSGWYLLGDECIAFEKEYSKYIGSKHTIGVANGLDALKLILRAYIELGIMKEKDEVIVPANTFIASILSITHNGLKPVLVDPDIKTFNLNFDDIERHINSRTKAIMVVHLYGQACWSEKLERIAEKFNLKIIEDNAQAAGAMIMAQGSGLWAKGKNELKLRRTGSLGYAAGHSFYPGKNLGALGDGGAVTTDDDDLASVIRSLANYGFSKKYVSDYKGYNSRLDEIQAAVLRLKLPYLDSDNQKRRETAQYYIDNIKNPVIILPGSSDLPEDIPEKKQINSFSDKDLSDSSLSHVWHIFPVRTSRRDELQKYLLKNDIQTLIHYPIPPHKQQCYSELNKLYLPITEKIHNEELSLPISQVMTKDEIEVVVRTINKWKEIN